MALICDECGTEARITWKPDEMHWLEWLMDRECNPGAMLVICDDEGVHAVCVKCFDAMADELRAELTPN